MPWVQQTGKIGNVAGKVIVEGKRHKQQQLLKEISHGVITDWKFTQMFNANQVIIRENKKID